MRLLRSTPKRTPPNVPLTTPTALAGQKTKRNPTAPAHRPMKIVAPAPRQSCSARRKPQATPSRPIATAPPNPSPPIRNDRKPQELTPPQAGVHRQKTHSTPRPGVPSSNLAAHSQAAPGAQCDTFSMWNSTVSAASSSPWPSSPKGTTPTHSTKSCPAPIPSPGSPPTSSPTCNASRSPAPKWSRNSPPTSNRIPTPKSCRTGPKTSPTSPC